MKRQPLGEQELALLRYLVDHGPMTVGEAAEQYGGQHGLARTTILTVMERLRQKGYLSRAKERGVFRYTARCSQSELLSDLVGDFAERMLGGSLQPFVAYLVENTQVTEEEFDQLSTLVRRLEMKHQEE